MLAPRKTLWSTPSSAIHAASRLAAIDKNDKVYDVGCGDGRVLVQLASTTDCNSFVGIEIDPKRAEEARQNVKLAKTRGEISADCTVEIRCENALSVKDYSNATIIFLYLIPRGLRLIKPLLVDATRQAGRKLRVITYMSALEGEICVAKEFCSVEHQSGAFWPVYLYYIDRTASSESDSKRLDGREGADEVGVI